MPQPHPVIASLIARPPSPPSHALRGGVGVPGVRSGAGWTGCGTSPGGLEADPPLAPSAATLRPRHLLPPPALAPAEPCHRQAG
ncbi:unnamed protein product [Gadus morhua 'NCC']